MRLTVITHPNTLCIPFSKHTHQVYWSESGELCCIAADDSYYILKYNSEAASEALSTNQGVDEDGVESAFEVLGEIEEVVKTGTWVGDCFIYTNSVNRLNYYVGGEIVTISHLDRLVSCVLALVYSYYSAV